MVNAKRGSAHLVCAEAAETACVTLSWLCAAPCGLVPVSSPLHEDVRASAGATTPDRFSMCLSYCLRSVSAAQSERLKEKRQSGVVDVDSTLRPEAH